MHLRRQEAGRASTEVVYHVSSIDSDSRTAEEFAELVRGRWGVETYHGRRDNGCLEDFMARRCGERLMSAMLVARTFECGRQIRKTVQGEGVPAEGISISSTYSSVGRGNTLHVSTFGRS